MKLATILILASLGLAGCVAVPVYPRPYARVYVAPAPLVVARPYYGHGYWRY